MLDQETKDFIIDILKKSGVQVPIEETFDYTGIDQVDKCKLFVKLVNGDWRNSIYVEKVSNRYLPADYYDLLFAVNTDGKPVCIPVPIAKKLWNQAIIHQCCKSTITGGVYETIYRKYYEDGELPF